MPTRNRRRAVWSRERGKHARDQLIAATAAIVLSQTGVVVGLLVAVRPELRDLREISRDHTLVVKQSAEIRGELSDLVGRISRAVTRGATPPDLDAPVAHVRTAVATMSPLADSAHEQELFADLSRALDGFESSARQLARSGTWTAPAAEELLAQIRARTAEAAGAAQALVAFNADQVRSASDGIRVAILRMTVVSVLAAALGTAAALVLLRMGWAGLARHEAEREARRAELDAFAGRVAHELRTPLQTIDLSLAAVEGSTSRPEIVDRARASVRSLDRTLRGLLEFSRAGGLPAEGSRARVDEAVEWSLQDLGWALAQPGARLDRQVEPELEVAMDPGHLRTVLVNLVHNSLKYGRTEEGAHVQLAAARAGDRVRFVVRDDGPGLAPQAAAHLFEPYYRGSELPDGYGLGLATVKRLVEAHGGELRMESASGRGTAVRFELPAPATAAADEGDAPEG